MMPGLRLTSDPDAVPKRSELAGSAVKADSYLCAKVFSLLATAIQFELLRDIVLQLT